MRFYVRVLQSSSLRASFLCALWSCSIHGNGIDPLTEPVVLQVGSSPISIPAGSFAENASGAFTFEGTINGAGIDVEIVPTSEPKGFVFTSYGFNPNLIGITSNPLPVTIIVGDDVATADVTPVLQ